MFFFDNINLATTNSQEIDPTKLISFYRKLIQEFFLSNITEEAAPCKLYEDPIRKKFGELACDIFLRNNEKPVNSYAFLKAFYRDGRAYVNPSFCKEQLKQVGSYLKKYEEEFFQEKDLDISGSSDQSFDKNTMPKAATKPLSSESTTSKTKPLLSC